MTSSREATQQAGPTQRAGSAQQAALSDRGTRATSSVSLCSLRERGAFRVTELKLAGEDEARIKNMGICAGRRIEILQPGDPLIVKVSGANVGVSRRLAVGILLEPWVKETREGLSSLAPATVPIAPGSKSPLSTSLA